MPPRTATSTAKAAGLRVIDETTPEHEARYEEVISTASVDRRLLSGPFASHVWGGRYVIDGKTGAGAQGTTFAGTDLKTGARVAVKLFDLGKAKDWKAQELFDREVATLKRLSHPGVPQFLDVIVDDDTGARALVMTHIAGESLAAVRERDKVLPEKRLWGLLVDVANVLSHVHGEGVVHRDIKPANLILRPDGNVAIVDFGGVGAVRAKAGSTVVGTFGFMAPEQLYGAQTPATDLYALGATVLALATGKEPEDLPRQGLAIDVDAAAPFLSEALRTLLKQLLAPEPEKRPKDAAALLLALKAIAGGRTRAPARTPDVIDDDDGVDAIWRDDAKDAARAAEGGFGILAAVIGTLAAVGLGRVLVPLILTLIAVFVDKEQAQKLRALREVVEHKAKQLQAEMTATGVASARTLEELSEKDRRRHERRKHKAQRRMWKIQEKLEREQQRQRDEWWKL